MVVGRGLSQPPDVKSVATRVGLEIEERRSKIEDLVATGFTPGEQKSQASPEVNSVATKKKPKSVLNDLAQESKREASGARQVDTFAGVATTSVINRVAFGLTLSSKFPILRVFASLRGYKISCWLVVGLWVIG